MERTSKKSYPLRPFPISLTVGYPNFQTLINFFSATCEKPSMLQFPLKLTLETPTCSNSRRFGKRWTTNVIDSFNSSAFRKQAMVPFCSRRTTLQRIATHHSAFPRPICRPALAHLRHQAEVRFLLRLEIGKRSHIRRRKPSPSHHRHLARQPDSQGRKTFSRSLEDVLQGHLHQGATQPKEAQTRHASPLLETIDRKADLTQKHDLLQKRDYFLLLIEI